MISTVCQQKYSTESIRAENPHFNTMACEQTFAWLSRHKKIMCAMNKCHFHFYLHRLVKHRNNITHTLNLIQENYNIIKDFSKKNSA